MASTEEKVKESISDLKEWLEQPNKKEDEYQRRLDEIKVELTDYEKVRKSIRLPFEYLDNWFSSNFIYELLTKEYTTYKIVACANGYQNIVLADKLTELYPGNPPKLPFDKTMYWLANCLSVKWYLESETLLDIINKGLSTKLLNGGLEIKPASWFILEIANRGYQKDINLNQFNYPENIGVYQEAINHWDTVDLEKLDQLVSILCDYHLEQASYGDLNETAGKNDPIFLQFSNAKWFVYVFEILSWLSIREKNGLINPEQFNHPLMNLKLNSLESANDKIPVNDLFNTVLNRL